MKKSVVNIDWLSLYCSFANYLAPDNYHIEKMKYQTKQFRVVEEVIYNNERVATITREPVSSVIKEHTGIIKIDNKILYLKNPIAKVKKIIKDLRIEVINISRIDICIDFNELEAYNNPHDLIVDFVKNKVLKNGRSSFQLNGTHDKSNVYDYLRFGKKSADVCLYMYNKSKEMREIKFKHHISNVWKLAGLDTKRDVWRIEVSISGEGKQYINEDTGEIQIINIDTINNKDSLINIFYSYLNKYFQFVVNDGKKNKSRMKKLVLFDVDFANISLIKLPKSKDTTRSDKILLKNIYLFDKERRQVSIEEREALRRVLDYMLDDEHLKDYFEKKKDFWNVLHYS